MAFEETREQQQMYNYFRSCIYIFLIIEIVMNLPVTADNRVTQFILDLLARFKVFNSVSGCKVGGAGVHLHCLHRDESEEGVEVQRAHDGGLSRAGRVDPCRAVLRVPRDVFRHQLVRLPGQPHPVRTLFGSRYHASAPGARRHRQVLQQQGGRRPLQLRERVVPAVGDVGRQRLFGEHPHDILLEAEDA